MFKPKSILLMIVCLLLLVPSIQAADHFQQGKELFLTNRRSFYSSSKQLNQIEKLLRQSKKHFSQLDNKFKKYYWQAQAEFVMAEVYEAKEEPRQAAKKFHQSEKLIKKALEQNSKASDAYRLLADTYMRQMSYKGGLYTMTYGQKALKLLQRAVELDKKNYTAYNSLGTYYLNAPKIGGGDINKGIKSLKKALASSNQFDNLISYRWLSIAYAKQDKQAAALNYIKKAFKIYPESKWIKKTRQQIKAGEYN